MTNKKGKKIVETIHCCIIHLMTVDDNVQNGCNERKSSFMNKVFNSLPKVTKTCKNRCIFCLFNASKFSENKF